MLAAMVWLSAGAMVVFVWALCRSAAHADRTLSTLDAKREFETRWPPKRDPVIGRDQVTRAERMGGTL